MTALRFLYSFPLFLLMGACSNLEQMDSGFLVNRDLLEPVGERAGNLLFVEPEVCWAEYETIWIADVEMLLPEKDLGQLSDSDLVDIKLAASKIAAEEFGRVFRLAEVAGDADLLLRLAITRLDAANVRLNAITGILAVPVDKGGIGVDLEILDTASGRRLLANSSVEKGQLKQIGGYFDRLSHPISGIRKILGSVVDIIRGAETELE